MIATQALASPELRDKLEQLAEIGIAAEDEVVMGARTRRRKLGVPVTHVETRTPVGT